VKLTELPFKETSQIALINLLNINTILIKHFFPKRKIFYLYVYLSTIKLNTTIKTVFN